MADVPDNALGARIRALRDAEGLSLGDLAEKTGVSKSYLWNLENKPGHQKPSADTVYAIAKVLGTTMSALLGRRLLSEPPDEIDETLQQFAKKAKLSQGEVRTLASINWRGDPPKSAERWRFVYDALKASKSLDH